ncbi:MAG TPA: tripartite tricarboxylate transporter substrate binding protein [Casimicrobiaceae bacterium]|nr:tripartite tricarboxylate transporter substrate binding protein [Casimicrobiaceae bacterium]
MPQRLKANGAQLARWLACVVAICAAAPGWAGSWPERPVRLIVAAPAGSSIDALARAIGERLQDRVGQPVVVENKPAAGGTVATAEVAKAAPDGYTLLLGFNGPLAFAPLLTKVPYDVAKDLAPVVIASSQPNVLAVNAELPVHTVPELVRLAKANPGKLAYASVGNGSASHLDMELFKSVAGFDALHVPFNGSPPAVMTTTQNETQMLFAVMQPLKAQIDAGRLRALAVTSAKRFALLPDLPTIAESGYPGFEALAWNGVLVPAATPAPIVARLNAEINAVLVEADVVARMHASGFELVGGSPEAFRDLIRGEVAAWTPVIRKLRLRID